jgi:pimeloyl-ACP methyl ester carboxylesterase
LQAGNRSYLLLKKDPGVKTSVLFIQGGGEGAHQVDDLLAASLQKALGSEYDVRYPRMPGESDPDMQTWKAKIARELKALDGEVILVGHSVGGAALLKYLAEEKVEKVIAGLFLLAAPRGMTRIGSSTISDYRTISMRSSHASREFFYITTVTTRPCHSVIWRSMLPDCRALSCAKAIRVAINSVTIWRMLPGT